MFSGGKGGKPVAQQTTHLMSLRVQTSAYGQAIPILIGTQRISGKLLDYDDFVAIAHTSTQRVGGKGGGSQTVSQTTYTYQAMVMLALCAGPALGVLEVWDSKGKSAASAQTSTQTIPGGATISLVSSGWFADVGVAIVTPSLSYWNDYEWDRGIRHVGDTSRGRYITYDDTAPMVKVGASPLTGQYSVSGGVYTFNAADIGKTVTISFRGAGALGTPLGVFDLTFFNGARPQSAWSYMSGAHPSKALAYSGLAYLASSALNLGDNAELPQLSYEVAGFDVAPGLTLDANPRDAINRILTDPYVGIAFPNARLDANTLYAQYCQAKGLFLSPLIAEQRSARDVIQEILDATNAAPVTSNGLLKIVPFADDVAAGNGVTFTPNTAPIYDLTEDDFIVEGDKPPITVRDADWRDAHNKVAIEFLDRAHDYNVAVMPEHDPAHIEQFGERAEGTVSMHCITEQSVAKQVASTRVKRFCYIDPLEYEFVISAHKYALLEAMDLVTLTSARQGFNKLPVRLKKLTEGSQADLACLAEPFPFATAQPTLYPKQAATPFTANLNAAPGSVNAPIIVEIPDSLSMLFGYEIRIAICGSDPNWGGCTVWVADDATTYKAIGRVTNPARMGVLTATLNVGAADPDVANTLAVDLSQSGGVLLSASSTDRDAFRTLLYIDDGSGSGEYLAYQTASLTGANTYNLTSLKRGLYGSVNASHASGKKIVRLDDAVFAFSVGAETVGKTLSFKFTSFNKWGRSEQSLADVSVYTFTLAGKFNNFVQVVGCDGSVDSAFSGVPANDPYLRVGGYQFPTPGGDWTITFKRTDGTTFTKVGQQWNKNDGINFSTQYFVLYSPQRNALYWLTTYSSMLAATYNGDVLIGYATTVASGGSGGTTGGGGGGFGGGGGGGGKMFNTL